MKIMQILNGVCHWDATPRVKTLEEAAARYAQNIVFVEAPDYVFPGWGYDPDREGDERFIRPTAPEGWLYDEKTGTFYQEWTEPPKPEEPSAPAPTAEERIAALEAENARKDAQIAALNELNDFHEELIVELANVVYA